MLWNLKCVKIYQRLTYYTPNTKGAPVNFHQWHIYLFYLAMTEKSERGSSFWETAVCIVVILFSFNSYNSKLKASVMHGELDTTQSHFEWFECFRILLVWNVTPSAPSVFIQSFHLCIITTTTQHKGNTPLPFPLASLNLGSESQKL